MQSLGVVNRGVQHHECDTQSVKPAEYAQKASGKRVMPSSGGLPESDEKRASIPLTSLFPNKSKQSGTFQVCHRKADHP